MVSTTNKNSVSLLLAKLKLEIPSPSHSGAEEFDFADVFGPQTNHASLDSSSSSTSKWPDPEIIQTRSHSLVGPSPRFAPDRHLGPFEASFHGRSGAVAADPILEVEDSDSDASCSSLKTEEMNDGGGDGGQRMGPQDFEILRVVGQGAFGKVFQVRKKGSSEIFAMKVMRKDVIIKKNHVEYMKAERDILTKVVHPFIVQLRFSFQTKSKLYLILDFINGGHLFFQLYRQGTFSEDQARVYTAEIVSAVSHLHTCGIIHRDLKPENILMDADGHVMLTDFGLAKELDESSRANSMCGTTEYMAPEIILSKGHNKDADWWSVGILLYEMLTGQPPFTHTNRQKLQQRIIKEKVKLPSYMSSDAHSLLKGLLQKEPLRRLGSGVKGGDDIKKQKWFRQINWKQLEARELQPRFRPEVSGRDCTANFDTCWTAMPLNDSPAPTPTAGEHFPGYTYVAPSPWLSNQEA